jgi:hypothetical protein
MWALLQRCDGAVVLALARSIVYVLSAADGKQHSGAPQPQPTPYNHLEGDSLSLSDYPS